jgi:hypothetical protein
MIYKVIERLRISDTETRVTSKEGQKTIPRAAYPESFKEIEDFLNQMSSEGWELVAVAHMAEDSVTDYIFRMA